MEYQEFLQTIKEEVRKQVPGDYRVTMNSVIKNNNQMLDAITIMEPDSLAPNIYLNRYYEDFIQGRSLESILQEILSISNNNKEIKNDMLPDLFNFDSIRSQIAYRLINLGMNQKRLNDFPYQVVEDMAKVYYLVVKSDSEGIASVAITNDLLGKWKVNIECIDKLAYENTPFLFPEKLRSMGEVIKEMITKEFGALSGENISSEDKELYEHILVQLTDDAPRDNDNEEMYILSNESGVNGASVILYENVLHDFAVEQQSNFYILPSSVHEVILLPVHKEVTKEALRKMVREVNNSEVPVGEVLSNEVYYFDLEIDGFHIV